MPFSRPQSSIIHEVCQDNRGSYVLAELDGSIWSAKVAAFRLMPYFSRQNRSWMSREGYKFVMKRQSPEQVSEESHAISSSDNERTDDEQ
jgi:hypothetical protein